MTIVDIYKVKQYDANNAVVAPVAPVTALTTLQNAVGANGNGNTLDVSGYATAVFNVSGMGTATVNFEASNDGGSTWVAINAILLGANTVATTATANGLYRANVAGLRLVRARISGWAAGAITVTAIASNTNGPATNETALLALLNGKLPTAALLADGSAIPTASLLGIIPLLYNGATVDFQRANVEGVALASAARTTTQSVDIINNNARGIIAFLNVTVASGTGGLTLRIRSKDPASGNYATALSATAAVITTGIFSYEVVPGGGSGSYTQGVSPGISRTVNIQVAVGDASSYTYSVGYALIN